jgi:hypothetical protein
MEYWLLGLLTFVFGYVTCRTFYFFRSARLSLTLLKAAHLVYLSVIIKALENLTYSREIMLEHMAVSQKSPTQISLFERQYESDVKLTKERSIETLRLLHPTFFKNTVQFNNWEQAVQYAEQHKEIILKFWEAE